MGVAKAWGSPCIDLGADSAQSSYRATHAFQPNIFPSDRLADHPLLHVSFGNPFSEARTSIAGTAKLLPGDSGLSLAARPHEDDVKPRGEI